MSAGTRVFGAAALLVAAGALMSWFGNPESVPMPKTTHTPTVTATKSQNRHVVISYEHRANKNDMEVMWDFGIGHKNDVKVLEWTVVKFDIDDVVPVGTKVEGSVHAVGYKYDPPEAFKIQIYVDNRPQCPDHFFGNGTNVECFITVA